MKVEELAIGAPTAINVGGRDVCVLRTGSEVLAFENRCPHRGHPLSEAECVDGVLRCALHGWEFSLPDGNAVSPPAPFSLEPLEVRISDGVVEVSV
jgi:nitrite reductase/ring-hydroxylating ferredoxin subunit